MFLDGRLSLNAGLTAFEDGRRKEVSNPNVVRFGAFEVDLLLLRIA
jgi:hypothetical protein